ncbi:NRDE family protein [Halomonas faecis]|uniref:NRDE family protein n=1 Tax=Halomonas faecis TaxID=1562110 RepID=UPI0013D41916|nr:NRDE family protein [Halomonas faecis]
MCLIVFRFAPGTPVPLRLVANRDEFHARPAAPLGVWEEAPDIVGGRDLEAGGTWLAVHRRGRFAAVTNVRDPALKVASDAPSRGQLVREALECDDLPAWLERLAAGQGWRYAGFNLLAGDGQRLWHLHRGRDRLQLAPIAAGTHGLSNASLNTPWPKLIRARQALQHAQEPQVWPERALAALADTQPADVAHLPDTGVGLERERQLSSPFILGERYGTRATTWLEWDADAQRIRLGERRFGPHGAPLGENELDVVLRRSPS